MALRSPSGPIVDLAAIMRQLASIAAETIRDVVADDEGPYSYTEIWLARRNEDVGFLISALNDDQHRWQAALSLSELGAIEAGSQIAELLGAPDRVTRCAAARALGAFDTDEFDEKLREVARTDRSEMVRYWCARAVGESTDWSSRNVLAVAGILIGCACLARRRIRRSLHHSAR